MPGAYNRRVSVPRRAAFAATLTFAACLTAACGAQRPAGPGNASGARPGEAKQFVDAVKFSHCMRAHGVLQFPDPRYPGGYSSASLDALDTSSPAFTSATDSCDRLLPNDGEPTPAEFEQAVIGGVKVAHCIRAHGFPNFPDPGIDGTHLTLNLANFSATPQFEKVGQLCSEKVYGEGR